MSPRRRSRRGQSSGFLIILILIAIVVWYMGLIPGLPRPETVMPTLKSLSTFVPDIDEVKTLVPDLPVAAGTSSPAAQTPSSSPAGGLPDMPDKPVPVVNTFQGCPPEGDGGDPDNNFLKNRVDEGDYVPVTFDAIAALARPENTERRDRANWSDEEMTVIKKYEGIPVMAEGYISAATESGPESTNCHGTSNELVDWHVSLVENPGEDRSVAIVTETTPRVRIDHKWSLDLLQPIIENQDRVRISGWLFYDPEHPEHIGKYRITLWEIHPIMEIEVLRDGQWVPLDNLAN